VKGVVQADITAIAATAKGHRDDEVFHFPPRRLFASKSIII
jgi:hypothetical protein